MEALVAVGFAANILQFVDYTCYVLKIGKQLRRKGMSETTSDLEKSAESLQHQIDRIRSQQGTTADLHQAGPALDTLAKECDEIATEILEFVKKFKVEKSTTLVLQEVPQQRSEHPDEPRLRKLHESAEKEWNEFKEKVQRDEDILKWDKRRVERLQRLLKELKDELKELLKCNGGKEDTAAINLRDRQTLASQDIDDLKESIKQSEDRLRPEKVRLSQLYSSKTQNYKDLQNLIDKESAKFDKRKRRIQDENEKAQSNSAARKKLDTLAKAIKIEWNKDKIDHLGERLDRIRNLLFSDVMLNIQTSVNAIEINVGLSSKRMELIATSHSNQHSESLEAFRQGRAATETILQAQAEHLTELDHSAKERHIEIVELINSFAEGLQEKFLFPALPQSLLGYDPSLKSAALNGSKRIENRILASLHFRRMEVREAQVRDAYEKTCSWIFEDPSEGQPWSNFRVWLKEGEGCYWIEGKAGCGKSTLMKFLPPDERTAVALKTWTGSADPLIAACFFWRAGSTLQNNQEGLIRTLLYSILSRRRELIAKVFSGQYNAMITKEFQNNSDPEIFFACDVPGCRASFEKPSLLEDHQESRHSDKLRDKQVDKHGDQSITDDKNDSGVWTLAELKTGFTTLAEQHFADFKICLFIDGMDEYVGDPREIIDLFRTVTKRSSIKAVISSRPEPAFVEAFRECPALRVERLIAGVIDRYVRNMLLSHSKMQLFNTHSSRLVTGLINAIASRACGVFLWVFLVVRLILERLDEGIFPEDLEDLIEEYPEELHDLYKHMFARMNPETRLEAFRLLQAVFFAHEVESSVPSALRLSYLERDKAALSIAKPVKVITMEELHNRISVVESRLRSRCCGLLEVQYESTYRSPEFQHWEEGQVEFLHRIVSDFLDVPGVRQILEEDALNTQDEIYESLLATILYRFKSWDFFRLRTSQQFKRYMKDLKSFLVYCQRCESHLGSRQNDYLSQLNKNLEDLWRIRGLETRSEARGQALARLDTHWAEIALREFSLKDNSSPDGNPLLSLAAGFGLNKYVHDEILGADDRSRDLLQRDGAALASKLTKWAMRDVSRRELYTEMIECLLTARVNVNTQYSSRQTGDGTTAWEDLVYLQPCIRDAIPFETWTELIELFVRSGAALDGRLKHFKGAARRPTARELIVSKMETSNFEKAPLEDLVVIEKGKQRIESLLAEIPVKAPRTQRETQSDSDGNPHSLSETLQDTNNDSPQAVPKIRRKRESGKRTKASTEVERRIEAALRAWTCSRCQKIDTLRHAGFDLGQIHQALDEKGMYCDIAELANTLLSKKVDDYRSEVVSPTKAKLQVGKARPPKLSTDSGERQWSVVTRREKVPERNEVVGAQWVDKPKKPKARKAKTLRVVAAATPCDDVHNNNADAIDLGSGTFTWFYEPRGKAASLTVEQKALLVDVIRGIIGA